MVAPRRPGERRGPEDLIAENVRWATRQGAAAGGHGEDRTPGGKRPARLTALVLTPPLAWSLHLLAVYFLVTMECYEGWGWGTEATYPITVLFALVALAPVAIAARRWRARRADGASPADRDDAHSSRLFAWMLAVLGGLFFAATIALTGLTPLLTPACG